MNIQSTDVAKASVQMAISTRESEKILHEKFKTDGILTVAVDIGGNINDASSKIIERALVASKKKGLIKENYHVHDGAVVGATREAFFQIMQKANGLNAGGKIGIARSGEHISICIFMSMGLLHLNEVVIGLAHRSIPDVYWQNKIKLI